MFSFYFLVGDGWWTWGTIGMAIFVDIGTMSINFILLAFLFVWVVVILQLVSLMPSWRNGFVYEFSISLL